MLRAISSTLAVLALAPAVAAAQVGTSITRAGCGVYACVSFTQTVVSIGPTALNWQLSGTAELLQAGYDAGIATVGLNLFASFRNGIPFGSLGWFSDFGAVLNYMPRSFVGASPGTVRSWTCGPGGCGIVTQDVFLHVDFRDVGPTVQYDFPIVNGISQVSVFERVQTTTTTVTPEPGTWALLGTGLFAVALVARRRVRLVVSDA